MRKSVHRYIAEHANEHVEHVRDYLKQPSVSIVNHGIRETAEYLVERHKQAGFHEVRLVETDGLPGFWAYCDAGAPKTLAVYCMFDTNEVGRGWRRDPFAAPVESLDPWPNVVYGVGAGSKGAYMAFLNAVEAIHRVAGTLPVNLVVLGEGEEFLGSTHFGQIIDAGKEPLRKAEYVVLPTPGQSPSGDVVVALGNKGFVYLEFVASGEAWGYGPHGAPVHSSAQGIVDNPAHRLIEAMSVLTRDSGRYVNFPEAYEDVAPASDEDRRLIDQLLARQGESDIREIIPGVASRERVKGFAEDLTGRELLERYLFHTTFNINGLAAGYVGPGSRLFTLPHEARCRVDMRLPHGAQPQKILAAIRALLDRSGYPDVEMNVLAAYSPTKVHLNDGVVQATLKMINERGVEPVIWPWRGASAPTGMFTDALGIRGMWLPGFGYASGHSGGEEFFVLEGAGKVGGLVEMEQSYADFLYFFAET